MGYRKQNPVTVDGVLYADANKVTSSTNAGTALQVLTSNGAGVAPTYQSVSASGAITTVTGNTGGAEVPLSGNFNVLGTGSITVAGSANTETVQLTGLTNHAVLVGAGTDTITKVGPTSTIGQVLQSAGAAADPAFSTATYPLTTTINQLLYSNATNTVTGLAAANRAVLTSGTTGVPVMTALATDGQLIIGSTAGVPAAATLTAGTGISITNASNAITIAVSGSTVGETITGDTGGALSPTAGNWNILANATAGSTVKFSGSVSTLSLNVSDASSNTLIGSSAGILTLSGSANTGIGSRILNDLTSGSNNVALGSDCLTAVNSGADNISIGAAAATHITTGTRNICVGSASTTGLVSGTNNVIIGYASGQSYTTNESSNILITSDGVISDANTTRIGTQGSGAGQQNKCFIAGITGITTTVANRQLVTVNSSTTQVGTSAFSVVTQIFTSTGTYTPTAGMLYCKVRIVGGGGAGGGAAITAGTTASAGSGGGAGEYAEGTFSAATIGASQAVTIAAAATGVSAANGNNGGTCSLGALITAAGGTGGVATGAGTVFNVNGSLGGTGGTGGSFRSPGRPGFYSAFYVTGSLLFGGEGGSSQFGAGGVGTGANAAGNAALGYGSGGSGALNFTNQAARAGGNGTAGIVVIDEYVIA